MSCRKGKKAPIKSGKKDPLQSLTNATDQPHVDKSGQAAKKGHSKSGKENLETTKKAQSKPGRENQETAKKGHRKPCKQDTVKLSQKGPDVLVKISPVQSDTKGPVSCGVEAEKKKTATDKTPVPPIVQPPCPPPVKQASPLATVVGRTTTINNNTTVKGHCPGKPTQRKINDFFKPIVHIPTPSSPAATAPSTSQEVEVLRVVI